MGIDSQRDFLVISDDRRIGGDDGRIGGDDRRVGGDEEGGLAQPAPRGERGLVARDVVRAPPVTPRPATILLIDDDEMVCCTVAERLTQEGHCIRVAHTGKQGMALLDSLVDLVLLDWKLPDATGLQLLRKIRHEQPEALVLVVTAFASVDSAVEAMSEGAFHYVAKPADLDMLALSVARALETTHLRRQLAAQRVARGPMARIVGQSPPMREVKRLLARVAASPASTVLLTGETGTGKDLAARALHEYSDRCSGPFLNITCSTLPSTLLESELFGHERGAFTDAKTRKKGLIEHADGGTLFLDEIGELELGMQSKLLRFLEERAFRRVGGTQDLQANVRVVAATNVDLFQAVRQGAFREDLFYRLAVVPIPLPPLRERQGDVELLVNTFIADFNHELKKRVRGLRPRALQQLEKHCWPGNVRELRNTIERAMLLTAADVLDLDDLPLLRLPSHCSSSVELPLEGIDLRELERNLLVQALRRCNGNQVRAAALLRISRDQIRYRIDKFGLRDVGRSDSAP